MALQGRCALLIGRKYRSQTLCCSHLAALTFGGQLNAKHQLTRHCDQSVQLLQNAHHHTPAFPPGHIKTLPQVSSLSAAPFGPLRKARTFVYNWPASASRRKYSKMASLETLNFDNVALRSLPIDPITENVPRKVTGACFTFVKPTPVENPEIVAVSMPALSLLGLTEEQVKRPDFVEYFSGNKLLPGAQTAAHCYCGHQFGNFAGQLGDGAAMYLGEVVNDAGERWEIQLKGAGPTPYSRTADGRKVLRSSIREFLCSEAMYHLGIPTTRAGSCITSDTTVQRDIYYTGHPIDEKCTIVLRIAQTFIRFGSFQICNPPDSSTGKEGPSLGHTEVLEQLTDYVIKTFYPEIYEKYGTDKKAACTEMFKEVVLRTARLVAQWQCVGWCHGVLNTDNMSILGLTIDYGPYAFMDRFDSKLVSNESDKGGRYAYDKQPEMCKWNCERLGFALAQLPYMDMEDLYPILDLFNPEFEAKYMEIMRKKLGLFKSEPEDKELIEHFLKTMEETGADFTNCFRCLSRIHLPGTSDYDASRTDLLKYLLQQCSTLDEMLKANKPKMEPRELQMTMMLLDMNPQLLDQLGIGVKSIYDDIQRMEKTKELKEVLCILKEKTSAQKRREDEAHWTKWLEAYTQRLNREAQGLSDINEANTHREKVMNSTNPRFILRNYIAQYAINAAERGDFSEVQHLVDLLQDPYSTTAEFVPLKKKPVVVDEPEAEDSSEHGACCVIHIPTKYDARPPSWAFDLRLT